MWSYVSQEQRIPADHPLRSIRAMVDEVLDRLSPRFDKLYSKVGRPSIPPERLLRALLLQVLYTIRSERLLMEQLDYNMLFRWFVGLNMDDPIWDPTVFTNLPGVRQGTASGCWKGRSPKPSSRKCWQWRARRGSRATSISPWMAR
jgi:transposase